MEFVIDGIEPLIVEGKKGKFFGLRMQIILEENDMLRVLSHSNEEHRIKLTWE